MGTHIFIVNKETFPIHLKYLFAGTRVQENDLDFENIENNNLPFQTEKTIVGLSADINRLREGDNVIFYLTQSSTNEGKFYGVFKVKGNSPLIFHEKNGQYLKEDLGTQLIFRTLIEPHKVYPIGVPEWEALDDISNLKEPNDLMWSLIYRKLKGNRGCTPITPYEEEYLIKLLEKKNNNSYLKEFESLDFDINSEQIIKSTLNLSYDTNKTNNHLNILNILKNKFENNYSHEVHLQSYITQNLGKDNNLNVLLNNHNEIIWLGNEVSCGVGMQRIDIFTITKNNNQFSYNVLELKCVYVYPDIIRQLQRYVDWSLLYIKNIKIEEIQPMILSLKIPEYAPRIRKKKFIEETKNNYTPFFNEIIEKIKAFNLNNKCKKIKFFEYEIKNDKLYIEEFKYE